MKTGRPSKYDPEICDAVIEFGKQGMSLAEMALNLGICRDTLNRWREKHDDFSDAVKLAISFSQGWWESKGRLATVGEVDGFNATAFVFNMKNRFRADWSDRVTNEIGGVDGKPIQTEEVGGGAAKLAGFLDAIAERSRATGEPDA